MLISFLQQVIFPRIWIELNKLARYLQIHSYKGFFDDNLEWVGVEGIQIVGTLTSGNTSGLSPRFMSLVAILSMRFNDSIIFVNFCIKSLFQVSGKSGLAAHLRILVEPKFE